MVTLNGNLVQQGTGQSTGIAELVSVNTVARLRHRRPFHNFSCNGAKHQARSRDCSIRATRPHGSCLAGETLVPLSKSNALLTFTASIALYGGGYVASVLYEA